MNEVEALQLIGIFIVVLITILSLKFIGKGFEQVGKSGLPILYKTYHCRYCHKSIGVYPTDGIVINICKRCIKKHPIRVRDNKIYGETKRIIT